YADSSAIPTYYVSRETRRHVTVALNGDGGDECFAGYERYAAMRLAERYRKLPAPLREGVIKQAVNLLPSSELRRSRVRSLKRFLHSASLPPVERYLRWVSVLDRAAKDALYTDEFQHETADFDPASWIAPWFTQANGAGVVDASLLAETILSEKALKRGLFKPQEVKRLFELHTRGERDYSHQLWTLLMLELWFERFIDS